MLNQSDVILSEGRRPQSKELPPRRHRRFHDGAPIIHPRLAAVGRKILRLRSG